MQNEKQEMGSSPQCNLHCNEERAIRIISKFNKLDSERATLDTTWEEIASLMMPRKAFITSKSSANPSDKESKLFDTTASDSLLTSAAGLMSWTTPKSEPWFSFDPSLRQRKNTSVLKWLGECTEIAQEILANSNFYSQRHESLIDKIAFGTSALFSQVNDDGKTYFENVLVGSYVIEENFMGIVDVLIRKLELDVRQAVQQFGMENLPLSLLECYHNGDNKSHIFLHCVHPRSPEKQSTQSIKSPSQKPFESIYIHKDTATVVKEGGFDSFPFHVGRYLTYNGNLSRTAWGYGPGFTALPEVRQLNYLQKMLDAYTEKAIFPPILVPDSFEGALDTNAKSIIYYNATLGAETIKPLEVTGNFSIALERLNLRKKAVESKFHVDLFQMLSNRQGTQPLTAEEVRALMSEKLDAISPAFDRDVTEVINPMMLRLFEAWAGKGLLPPPPMEAVESVDESGTVAEIPNPQITMAGRLSLAIKNVRNMFTDSHMRRIAGLAALDSSVLDNFNMDKVVKSTTFYSGMDMDSLRDDDEVQAIRDQRAQAQQAQQQAAMLMEAGKVAGPQNVSKMIEGQM